MTWPSYFSLLKTYFIWGLSWLQRCIQYLPRFSAQAVRFIKIKEKLSDTWDGGIRCLWKQYSHKVGNNKCHRRGQEKYRGNSGERSWAGVFMEAELFVLGSHLYRLPSVLWPWKPHDPGPLDVADRRVATCSISQEPEWSLQITDQTNT